MDEVGGSATRTLSDDELRRPGVIGPIELRFRGKWARVDDVLSEIPHSPVLYRWRSDSVNEMALFIEVPVDSDMSADSLLAVRDKLREEASRVIEYPIYVTFVDGQGATDEDNAGN